MRINRIMAAAVVVSLVASALPATAWASDEESKAKAAAKNTAAVDLRGSSERALANVAVERVQPAAPAPKPQKTGRRNAANGGGGGGGMGTAMAIIGVAASIGTTYFVIKEMHKTETQLTVNPQGGGR